MCLCVCGMNYPAFNAHAQFCILICEMLGCDIFVPHYLIIGTIFEGRRVTDYKKCGLTASTTFI
jgi:hypothetical protein